VRAGRLPISLLHSPPPQKNARPSQPHSRPPHCVPTYASASGPITPTPLPSHFPAAAPPPRLEPRFVPCAPCRARPNWEGGRSTAMPTLQHSCWHSSHAALDCLPRADVNNPRHQRRAGRQGACLLTNRIFSRSHASPSSRPYPLISGGAPAASHARRAPLTAPPAAPLPINHARGGGAGTRVDGAALEARPWQGARRHQPRGEPLISRRVPTLLGPWASAARRAATGLLARRPARAHRYVLGLAGHPAAPWISRTADCTDRAPAPERTLPPSHAHPLPFGPSRLIARPSLGPPPARLVRRPASAPTHLQPRPPRPPDAGY
jgi:hypothetical protein